MHQSGDQAGQASLRGGEGQLFLSKTEPNLALKRWFGSRVKDMPESIRRLERAAELVDSTPTLKKNIDVVKIHEKGSDWILRDFDADSFPLKNALGDESVAAVHKEVVSALKGTNDEILEMISKKITKNPPSANLHWSPSKQKILIIDMQ